MKTIYKTNDARKSAITVIDGCVKAIQEEEGLPYKIGTLTVDYIVKYLCEYKSLIEKEMK